MLKQKQDLSIEFKKLWNKQLVRMIIGAIAGSIVGMLYWNYVGCNNGTCPLTNTPFKTIAFFTIMGAVFTRKNSNK